MGPFEARNNPIEKLQNVNIINHNKKPARVLVVDDDEDILPLLNLQLKQAGYQVTTASDGRTALALLEQRPFDIVVTDAMMPEMTGYELVKKLRATPVGATIPVIMVTALSSEEDALQAFRQGVDDFVEKPYNAGLLRAKIAALLQNRLQQTVPLVAAPSVTAPLATPGCSSGLMSLDQVLGGNWPGGSNILVTGDFGSGKSTFARRFLAEGLQQGESTLMVVVDDSPHQVRRQLDQSLNGRLAALEQADKFRLVDAVSWSTGHVHSDQERFVITGKLELTGLAGAIVDAGTELGQSATKKAGGRRVIDSISSLFVYFDLAAVQRFLMQLARTAGNYGGVSTLFLLEQGTVDDRTLNNIKYFMDGIFEFRRGDCFEMRVANLKWQTHSKDWFAVD